MLRAGGFVLSGLCVLGLACGGQTALPTGGAGGSGAAGVTVVEGAAGLSGSGGDIATGAGGSSSKCCAPPATGAGGAPASEGLTSAEGAACAAVGGDQITFKNTADAQASLVGVWVLCRGGGLTQATEQTDQAGIELDADMTWHLLRRVTGTLVRADGFGASGPYTFPQPQDLDFGSAPRVDLFFGLDFSFYEASILDSPRKMAWTAITGMPSTSLPTIYAREPGAAN
jgi:hypothetical protein